MIEGVTGAESVVAGGDWRDIYDALRGALKVDAVNTQLKSSLFSPRTK